VSKTLTPNVDDSLYTWMYNVKGKKEGEVTG
jgi:hypothetical protein